MSVLTIANMLGGEVAVGDPCSTASEVCTDSRSIKAGDVFIALRGERFDGHDYIIESMESGTSGVVAESLTREQTEVILERQGFGILVEDTLKALQSLASRYRQTLDVTCIAITGSTGKTTVKDMVKSVLSAAMPTVATERSMNNEIGLPLTILNATDDTRFLVLELGMRGLGQIEELSAIAKPDIGVITNVNDTHIELLGSRERIAQAKSELVEAIPESGGVVLNGDDPLVMSMADKCRGRVVTVGLSDHCDIRATEVSSIGALGVKFRVESPEPLEEVIVGIPGVHNVSNALLALGVCYLLGCPLREGSRRLENISRSGMRLDIKPARKGVTVIDDSYNASPVSMLAALRTLMEVGSSGRTIAVLGDMLELGTMSEEEHRRIGRFIADAGPDITLTVGDHARLISEEIHRSGSGRVSESFGTTEEASQRLRELLQPGDTVLIKGSRSMRMDCIVGDLDVYLGHRKS